MDSIAMILLNHSSFVSVPLLRCNRQLSSLLKHTSIIQAVRRSICKRLATHACSIPYEMIDADGIMPGKISIRTLNGRKWMVRLAYEESHLMYSDGPAWHSDRNTYPKLSMICAFPSFDTISSRTHVLKRDSLTERCFVSHDGNQWHVGMNQICYGWEEGATSYWNGITYGFDLDSFETDSCTAIAFPGFRQKPADVKDIRLFFTIRYVDSNGYSDLMHNYRQEYINLLHQRMTDTLHGDGVERLVPPPIHRRKDVLEMVEDKLHRLQRNTC